MRDVEKIIDEVNGSMAMERMPLTQSDKGSICDIFYEEKYTWRGNLLCPCAKELRVHYSYSHLFLRFVSPR